MPLLRKECGGGRRTDFVRADIRHSLVGKLVRGLRIDTVVHAGLIVDPQQASGRTVHETNVIGTMNLLAACSGPDSPVRRLVVKSSRGVWERARRSLILERGDAPVVAGAGRLHP